MDKFLETHNLLRLNQKEIEDLDIQIMTSKSDKDTVGKEKNRPISLMNIDTKILKKILTNQIKAILKGLDTID